MNYHIVVKFGDVVLPVNVSNLRELTIIQDLNRFLPEFRLRIWDNSGHLTHVLPFDRNMSKVYLEFGQTDNPDDTNSFNFDVFTRRPEGTQSNPSTLYDITGLLSCPGLFSPDYCRGSTENVKTKLETIANSELSISDYDVSSSLSFSKKLVQPLWSNIQFLKYLKEKLIGSSGEYGFKCFVMCQKKKQKFVFKSLKEMIKQAVSYKFIVNDTQYQDRLPIYSYYPYDYYKIHELFASKKQSYSYFDYDTSEFVQADESATDYEALTNYYLIDQNDSEDSNELWDTGRSNEFTSDFLGQVKSSFSNRLMNLAKMWITTNGLANIAPGSVIDVFFPHGAFSDDLCSYQYSGRWLVEKVVHNIGDTFLTKLLLTRSGPNTDKNTTLLKATNKV